MTVATTIQSGVRSLYDLAFQVSPIILVNGIAANTLGGMMPIIGLTGQLAAFAQGVVSSGGISADDFYARFVPVPGGTVISNAVATYPFASNQVAANAIIEQPLSLSMLMIAPVKDAAGYLTKTALFTALRSSLRAHIAAGGLFHVATPALIYDNMLMTGMTDVTNGEGGKQQQIQWEMTFVKPLVTQADATSAQNSLMSKLTGGQSIIPSGLAGTSIWSSAASTVGTAAQGAAQGINNLTGAVSTFLTQ